MGVLFLSHIQERLRAWKKFVQDANKWQTQDSGLDSRAHSALYWRMPWTSDSLQHHKETLMQKGHFHLLEQWWQTFLSLSVITNSHSPRKCWRSGHCFKFPFRAFLIFWSYLIFWCGWRTWAQCWENREERNKSVMMHVFGALATAFEVHL